MIKYFFVIAALLFLIPSESFSQVKSELFLEGTTVYSIESEQDFLWVATYGHGIFRYSKKEDKWFNFSTSSNNLENDLFYSLAVGKDYVWAGSVEGLFIYDKKKNKWTKRKFAQGGEMGNWIRALYYDASQNVLWIGRFANLTRFDVAKQRYNDYNLTQGTDLKSNNIKSIKADGDSLIWFGTESGVHKFYKKKNVDDKTNWQYISNKKNGFNNEGDAVSVSDFLFESENVWFATDEFVTSQQPQFNMGGVYRFNRKLRWDRISKQNGLAANGIYCIERTGNIIWLGLYYFDKKEKKEYGKGLAAINRVTGKLFPIDLNSLNITSSTFYNLYFDGTYMWAGTDQGLLRIEIDNPLAKWTLKKSTTTKNQQKKK
jgi:ligand-binding sensor domain-containing protein